MKRLLLVAFSMFTIGCGSGGFTSSDGATDATATAPAPTTSTAVKADGPPPGPPESPSLRAFESAVEPSPGVRPSPPPGPPAPAASPQVYTLDLHPGWNPVAFQCSRVLSVQKPPEVRGYVFYDGSGYPSRPLNEENTNEEDEGARRGLYLFATGPCTLTYTGIDDNRGDFVKLRRGWNMVSFVTATRIDSRRFTALVLTPEGPHVVPVNSVILPQFFRLERDGGQLMIDVISGAELEPGRPYWIFAERECALVWGRPPVLQPSPGASPLPKPSPSVRPEPSPKPSPSVEPTPSPKPEPTPTPTPEATPEPTPEATPEPAPEASPAE